MQARNAASATSARPMTSRWCCSSCGRRGSRTPPRRGRRRGLRLGERVAIRGPLRRARARPSPAATEPRTALRRPAGAYHGGMSRTPRVLVVEDDVEIAGALRRSLALEGYEVELAGDGVDALGQAETYEPDLVVLDLGLPKL